MTIEIKALGLTVEVDMPPDTELVYIRDFDPGNRTLKPEYDYVFTTVSGIHKLHYRGTADRPPSCSDPRIAFKHMDPGPKQSARVRVG